MKTKHTLAALSVAAMIVPAAGFAQDDPWQFGVSVPLWAPQIDGNATVKGHKQDVGISFSDLKNHLDASFALAVSARKGKLGFFGDVGYMRFSADTKIPINGKADFGLKFLVADAGLSYQLIKTESDHPFILEGTGGLRYWYTATDLTFKDGGGNPYFTGGKERNLEDPVIGLRASQYFTPKLHLDVAGDIGGFGISDSQADLDWSASGVLTYDFAKWFSLSGGYKALALDVTRGSGANKNGMNVIFNGFLLAATFKF